MFGKMGEMGKMMGQMKDMKKNLANVQTKIQEMEQEATVNGVTVLINGAHVIQSINIDNSLMEDKELLEDLIVTACNEANQKVVNKSALMMQEVTGGLDLPF